MKAIHKAVVFSILVVVLSACNMVSSEPTQSPTPVGIRLPTLTSTFEPTITPTPTEEPTQAPLPPTKTPSESDLPMPTGKPVENWEGLPVMPDAIAGDGDSNGYSFTIHSTPDKVQLFYEKELGKLGWNFLAVGEGATSPKILIFTKGSATASVMIISQSNELLYVMLVK